MIKDICMWLGSSFLTSICLIVLVLAVMSFCCATINFVATVFTLVFRKHTVYLHVPCHMEEDKKKLVIRKSFKKYSAATVMKMVMTAVLILFSTLTLYFIWILQH